MLLLPLKAEVDVQWHFPKRATLGASTGLQVHVSNLEVQLSFGMVPALIAISSAALAR